MAAAGLIEQLQAGVTDGRTPLDDLLRKVRLTAAKLKLPDLAAWADAELSGYNERAILPPYRMVYGKIKGRNPFHGWLPVIGMPEQEVPCYHPVAFISALVAGSGGESVSVTINGPAALELIRATQTKTEFQVQIPIAALTALLAAIRDKILSWTIELENKGVRGEGLSFSEPEIHAARSVTTQNIFHGPVAAFSQGHSRIESVSQTVSSMPVVDLAPAIRAIIEVLQRSGTTDPSAKAAVAILAEAEKEAPLGKPNLASRIKAALTIIGTSEDIALKAPEVIQHIQSAANLFGITL